MPQHEPAASRHPPFAEVEASRPDFDQEYERVMSKAPQPDWKSGQGLNNATHLKNYAAFQPNSTPFTTFDPQAMIAEGKAPDVYKIMIGGIVPRPICFCSSISADGNPNLAPFSYFNMICHNPPLIIFSCTGPKDTARNVKATKEFVANIISEPFVEAANYTSISAPSDTSEWPLSGLTKAPSEVVKPSCVAESAFSLECVLENAIDLKTDEGKSIGTAIIGRVKRIHVRSDIIDDKLVIDPFKLLPVSRLGGITYARVDQTFEIPRPDARSQPSAKTS